MGTVYELIGIGGMTVEMKQTYDRTLLMRAIPNFVHAMFGRKSTIPPGGGKSIEFRRMERITVNTGALTEGTAPESTVATFSNVAATISQYGMWSGISDLLETQSFDPVIAEYAENYGEVMGDVLDQVVRDVIVAGTTVQYASTAATRTGASGVGSGMYLDSAEIREAVRTLEGQNAKKVVGDKYACILHPDVKYDLFADPDVVKAFTHVGPRDNTNPLITAVLGDYMGVTFIQTTNAKVFASLGLSGADVYACLFIAKEAYGVTDLSAHQNRMIIHPRGTGGHSDPLEQLSTVGWKAALAAVILNNNFMVRVEVNSSAVTAA